MTVNRISLSSVVKNQLPLFVRSDYPLFIEFLQQYYLSVDSQGLPYDLIQNIDKYVKIDNILSYSDSTILVNDINEFTTTIVVETTEGFPEKYGLLLINDEIITYKSKTDTEFINCIRGFSGITSYDNDFKKDSLIFEKTKVSAHDSQSVVTNLSILFLKQFLIKIKTQITPGFEYQDFFEKLNQRLFIKQARDFYTSKGTANSFNILFGALYGENVDVLLPSRNVIEPSSAIYRITRDIVVEEIDGDIFELENTTLYQDDDGIFQQARGTITKIEKIYQNNKDYFQISLDYDYNKDIDVLGSIKGKFPVHNKTKTTDAILKNSYYIDVDSTFGFPDSGKLDILLDNRTINCTYTHKTLTQFLGCVGITENISENTDVAISSYAYGFTKTGKKVKVRITGVLSDLNVSKSFLYKPNDTIRIKTLGSDLSTNKINNWFYNISGWFNIESISLLDTSDYSYSVTTFDENNFNIGNSFILTSNNGQIKFGNVVNIQNNKTFVIRGQGELDTELKYKIERKLSKVNISNYSDINFYNSNVNNTFIDLDNNLYVSTPSIPTYLNRQLTLNNKSIVFSGTFNGEDLQFKNSQGTPINHTFYTGDSVYYRPSNTSNQLLPEGIYYVKVVNNTTVKLAKSKENIYNNIFFTLSGSVINDVIEYYKFLNPNTYETKLLEPQDLIRKLSNPINDEKYYETPIGQIGIFINGVELFNYKSPDFIYYGKLQKIIPTSKGSGYDVVNPPTLMISDPIGYGATGFCNVSGKFDRIDIVDPGFDYIEVPTIEITGGNGIGAIAKANLISYEHENDIIPSSSNINLSTDIITFNQEHRFRQIEDVIYKNNSNPSIGGLINNSIYTVKVIDKNRIQLYPTVEYAISGINTINITSYSSGTHTFKSVELKRKIGSVDVINPGIDYENNKTVVSGINTAGNFISIPNNNYKNGSIVTYTPTGTPISGLTSSASYYITKINDSDFRLSEIGIGNTSPDFYYKSKQYVKLTSNGSGIHYFNYPDISVKAIGRVGVSTFSGLSYSATLQPVVRGEITTVFLVSGGNNYGTEEIINYNKQPEILLTSGSGAQLKPIIDSGKIVDVIIQSSGSGYTSIPDLVVNGLGVGAKLVPVISNGLLINVIIDYPGTGYFQDSTTIDVVSTGNGAKFEAVIKHWHFNEVERSINNNSITEDDGFIQPGQDNQLGLQYSHIYAPRSLRSSVLGTKYKDGEKFLVKDLELFEGKEIFTDAHSPIIGWAYDGNPIYGPYGYSDTSGGSIKLMESGYSIKSNSTLLSENRPSFSLYPIGEFVEDYYFSNSGDLDEFNGRFVITPEYPNGIYAYFCTINSQSNEQSGPFKNYRKPIFPYIVGNNYKSRPINYNFELKTSKDIEENWLRNTHSYNLTSSNSGYDYLYLPYAIKTQLNNITHTENGTISGLDIVNGGENYKINDLIILTKNTAKVSKITGVAVSSIFNRETYIPNVELIKIDGNYIGIGTTIHSISSGEVLKFNSNNDSEIIFKSLIKSNELYLSRNISSSTQTGIVTYFDVYGNLNFPNIIENDIYLINNEKVKILKIDSSNSRIQVLRGYDNTSGLVTHYSGTPLRELTRKIIFSNLSNSEFNYNMSPNRELYFNPKESVGLGTRFGPGITSTLYISNPGIGDTQIVIPTKTIYLKDHDLNTGDIVIYSNGDGTSVSISTNGVNSSLLQENTNLYVTKINNDLIGISTNSISIGSTNTLYFVGVGTGILHSFTTLKQNKLYGEIYKNDVYIVTADAHNLSTFDRIDVDIKSGVTTSIVVKYNNYNRRLIINPRDIESVDTVNDNLYITNHKLNTGEKVIYTTASSIGGLTNNSIYYVIKINRNKIKLASSKYNAEKTIFVDLTSNGSGTINPINPNIKLYKNNIVEFDLSDSSLSFIYNSQSLPAFEFKLFKDKNFYDEFISSQSSSYFEVTKTGIIGVDTTAKLSLKINDNTPTTLYYSLIPILENNIQEKIEYYIDDEQILNNQISINESNFAGSHVVQYVDQNTVRYNVYDIIESDRYIDGISYVTSSSTAVGAIFDTFIENKNQKYNDLPIVENIITSTGKNAIIDVKTETIGKIKKIEIRDIGFNYNSDITVRPEAKLPEIIKVSPLSSFKYIKVEYPGYNYLSAPDLLVFDGKTNKLVTDIELDYNLTNPYVTIIKNTKGINNAVPTIIPINNTNGIGINSIFFNTTTKDVTLTLSAEYSDIADFPFTIGTKILIENVSVASTEKGYNSENYNNQLFTVDSFDANIGGIGATITYNIKEYLDSNEHPGTYNKNILTGIVVPEIYFPKFKTELMYNNFVLNETVVSSTASGIIERWDNVNRLMYVSSDRDFTIGDTISGNTSGTNAIILDITKFTNYYNIDSTTILRKGWQTEKGFLNLNTQRIHDSDYYQYFSYDLESKVPYDIWNNSVNALNHTAGFKNFSSLVVDTKSNVPYISTSQYSDGIESEIELSTIVDFNCVKDFDLAKENYFYINDSLKSSEIYLNSKIIQDYIQSIGNRVLMIDDISYLFDSNERPDKFSVINTTELSNIRYQRYFINISDDKFLNESEHIIVSMLNDYNSGYINSYGEVYSSYPITNKFEYQLDGNLESSLLFYPKKYSFNNYNLNFVCLNFDNSISGISTLSLGNIAKIESFTKTANIGIGSTNLVGISSSFRSMKLMIQYINSNNSYIEFDELNILHNNSQIYFSEYGQLTNNGNNPQSGPGLGTYFAYFSGSNVNIDLISKNTLSGITTVNVIGFLLSNNASTGIGTTSLDLNIIDSSYTAISSSPSPVQNTIASYSNSFTGSYFFVSVEDTTNNYYQLSEIVTTYNSNLNSAYISEFAGIRSNIGLGTFGINVNSNIIELKFTPNANINCQTRVFAIKTAVNSTDSLLQLNKLSITSGTGKYTGTVIDVKRSFELYHNNLKIFERSFNANDSNVIDLQNNIIKIPNHYFTTGEEITYSITSTPSDFPIGIATTTIPDIGSTNILPSKLYVVKKSDIDIQVAASATDALLAVPKTLDLTTLGGGIHKFTSKNQNKKAIISIDNVIQKPIIITGIEYTVSKNMSIFDSEVYLTGITSIYADDIIKIDDEVMRVNAVGVGSTNSISVDRPWLGTTIGVHTATSKVYKLSGDYNIVNNTIHFISAPYGNSPIPDIIPKPDEIDFTGITTSSQFSGRIFLRNGLVNSGKDPYTFNYLFDDISSKFDGSTTDFNLTQNKVNITGVSTSNAIILIRNIFQGPQRLGDIDIIGDYSLKETSGITSIRFTGTASSTTYDVNTTSLPRGGIIQQIGSISGLGFQPLVAAGGTANVSASGTITSIAIGNSGSGYRVGIQTVINVGVKTASTSDGKITIVGRANVLGGFVTSVTITNPGAGFTRTNPPLVVFDNPVGYTNIPLVYSNPSSGNGKGATVDIVVGQGSSVINFELRNSGYGYGNGEVLTVGVGGTVGIPTNTSIPFSPFKITIDRIYNDDFSGFSVGDLQVFDPIDDLFDGVRKVFPLKLNGRQITIRKKPGSNLNINATLLIFINDILQVPEKSYEIVGGSLIQFTEAPKGSLEGTINTGDKSKIIFYKGTGEIDVKFVDIIETIKSGDNVFLFDEDKNFNQNNRTVIDIQSSDTILTNTYPGPGISENDQYERSLTWCRQTEDKFINGKIVGKDRAVYEALISPNCNIIQPISIGSTEIFVDKLKIFFDSENENDLPLDNNYKNILIVSQENTTTCTAQCVVSGMGTISAINIIQSGNGYSGNPMVSIGYSSTDFNELHRATASAYVSNGIVTSIIVTNGGIGYTNTNLPLVMISPPTPKYEFIENVNYEGDFGIIVGYSTVSTGVAKTGITFDFYIPTNSYLRNENINTVGMASTGVSGIQTNYYFIIENSNIGKGVTSLTETNTIVGVGTTFIDNIYKAVSVSYGSTFVTGIGITNITKVTVSLSSHNGIVGSGYSNFYGNFSWGRISNLTRRNPQSFVIFNNGILGVSTSPILSRILPLKYQNYNI